MNTGLVNDTQIVVRTDSGDEGGVIYASANALLQGLFPPTSDANTTLSNGTTVTAPLGGYQYVPSMSCSILSYSKRRSPCTRS